VNDLRTHVEEKHSMEYSRLEKDFFTEGNAYWIAIYPEDYRKIALLSKLLVANPAFLCRNWSHSEIYNLNPGISYWFNLQVGTMDGVRFVIINL
jgi:hypothetical protein